MNGREKERNLPTLPSVCTRVPQPKPMNLISCQIAILTKYSMIAATKEEEEQDCTEDEKRKIFASFPAASGHHKPTGGMPPPSLQKKSLTFSLPYTSNHLAQEARAVSF